MYGNIFDEDALKDLIHEIAAAATDDVLQDAATTSELSDLQCEVAALTERIEKLEKLGDLPASVEEAFQKALDAAFEKRLPQIVKQVAKHLKVLVGYDGELLDKTFGDEEADKKTVQENPPFYPNRSKPMPFPVQKEPEFELLNQ